MELFLPGGIMLMTVQRLNRMSRGAAELQGVDFGNPCDAGLRRLVICKDRVFNACWHCWLQTSTGYQNWGGPQTPSSWILGASASCAWPSAIHPF